MTVLKKSITALLFCLFISFQLHAQITPRFEVGAGIGTMVYQGDLSEPFYGDIHQLRMAYALYLSKPITDTWSIRFNVALGHLASNENDYNNPAYHQQRNFSFHNSTQELALLGVYNFMKSNYSFNDKKLQTYIMAGAGIALMQGSRDWSKMNTNVFPAKSATVKGLGFDTTRAMPKALPVIPIGIGAKYKIADNFFMHAEVLYRYTFSDYIDGFSYAANPYQNDSYYSLTVGVSYVFTRNRMNCPKLKQ